MVSELFEITNREWSLIISFPRLENSHRWIIISTHLLHVRTSKIHHSRRSKIASANTKIGFTEFRVIKNWAFLYFVTVSWLVAAERHAVIIFTSANNIAMVYALITTFKVIHHLNCWESFCASRSTKNCDNSDAKHQWTDNLICRWTGAFILSFFHLKYSYIII